ENRETPSQQGGKMVRVEAGKHQGQEKEAEMTKVGDPLTAASAGETSAVSLIREETKVVGRDERKSQEITMPEEVPTIQALDDKTLDEGEDIEKADVKRIEIPESTDEELQRQSLESDDSDGVQISERVTAATDAHTDNPPAETRREARRAQRE